MRLSCRSASKPVAEFERPALVVGHPGHELKAFGWMFANRPRVYVLTDGSGRHGASRISSTAALLPPLGACRGEIFGRISDGDVYTAILEQNLAFFFHLVDELAASFLKHRIDCVAGDSAEGFNPTHDLCRALINSALLLVERRGGREITNFEISLTEWEQDCPQPRHDERCLHWELDDSLLAAKITAAEQYVELRTEVLRAIAQRGEEYFRVECFRRTSGLGLARFGPGKPAYEVWGEKRVAEGRYQNVIRFEQHVWPVITAILNYAGHATLEPSLVGSKR